MEVTPERSLLPLPGGQQAASRHAKAVADTGISSQAASRYQALADVPKDLIEEAFRDPDVKHFRKAHKNILQAFDRLLSSAEFSQLNFEPRDFIDARGKPQRTTQMTTDCSATACESNALFSPEYHRHNFVPMIETVAVGNLSTDRHFRSPCLD